MGLGKKHKKKFLRREERKKDKKEHKRIETEKRQKIKDEEEQKKVNLAEEKIVKKREKRKRQKQKQKEKQRKETTQVWDFMKKAEQKKNSFKKLKEKEQKKSALNKLNEKELVEIKSALNKFAKQFTVDGEPDFDPKSFFNATRKSILKILRENRQQKVKLILKCLMNRIDLKTGEETKTEAVFHSEIKKNYASTNEKKILKSMIEEVLENMAKFQRRGDLKRFSSWNFILLNLFH